MAHNAGLKAWTAIGLLMGVILPLGAQAQHSLTNIQVTPQDQNQFHVELTLPGGAPEPSVFALDTPPRISIDLPDTALDLANPRMTVNTGPVTNISAVQASGRSRVVISLSALPTYTVNRDGDQVVIVLDAGSSAATTAAVVSRAAGDPRGARASLRDVDFQRTETGAGQLNLTLSQENLDVDVQNEGGRIVALLRNVQIEDDMLSRLDVLDFATPFKFVELTRDGINTKVSISPVSGAKFEQIAYQLGNKFTLELQPLTKQQEEELAREQPQYTGERLNMNFQNIEVRALLQIIADVAGKNLVTSDSVQGSLTLRLENVPWDQALDIVMRTKGLSQDINGNVIWVAPTAEVAAQQAQEIEARKQADELAPLVGEIIQVNYAKAGDLAALLEGEESSFLSERGRVSVDPRTNVLILQDTREKLADIQRLVTRLDIPVRQVLIESRIVIANDDFTSSIGSSFGVSVGRTSGNTIIGGSGTIGGASLITQSLANGLTPPTALPPATNFPAASAASQQPASYGISILGSDFLVDLELSALQAEGKGEVVSTPRVITADGHEALIEQGEEIPYISAAGVSGAAETQFKKAVLALRVRPQITPDNRVVMDLEVSKDSRGAVAAQGQPAIDTRSVNTQVLVNNGETVVLGGIFEQTTSDGVNKVPLLGDLPIIGYLFKNRSRENSKSELLIFVTPKILSEGINTR